MLEKHSECGQCQFILLCLANSKNFIMYKCLECGEYYVQPWTNGSVNNNRFIRVSPNCKYKFSASVRQYLSLSYCYRHGGEGGM